MKALVLAAGKSTRIASISKGLPKPLIEVHGKSVLKRNLTWLAQFGFRDIWINLHYRAEDIINHLGQGDDLGLNIQYAFEPEILGTAGAVKHLQEEWKETFLVVYGDNLFQFSLDTFISFHQSQKTPLSIGVFDRSKHLHTGIAGGRVVLKGSYVQGFIEGGNQAISNYVNAGVYLLEPKILEIIPEETFFDFGNDLFPKCIHNDIKISGHIIEGYCLGIDTPESYQNALTIINN